jgi:hypothetical protein
MSMPKLTSILLSAFVATTCVGMTACKKDGGSKKGKSERLRWVNKPVSGTTENNGKLIKIPGLGVDFYTPDVLYVYKNCVEADHTPEGPDKAWVPVIRCTSTSSAASDDEEDSWDSEDEDDDSGGEAVLTIYATDKSDMIINERSTASYKLQYEQAGFEVDSISYFEEYLAKPGRRGIEVVVRTVDSDTGYFDREIRRFMFPKDDVVFIAHVDYSYAADKSGINSDWERILWNFHYAEDGPLFE